MKKSLAWLTGPVVCLLLAACLLTGCAALLERSYSVSEPYADRYWDSGAEDTLRVDNYQELVNSLLLLIVEGAEDGVIRCYGEVGEYQQVMAARAEVRRETMLGSYLLKDLRLSHESGTGYSTVSCYMTYREDAEDLSSIMTLSDSQSLVDLLRLTIREERDKLTARFSYDMPRSDVTAAVESFWEEMCRAEMEEALQTAGTVPPEAALEETGPDPEIPGSEEPPEDSGSAGDPPLSVEALSEPAEEAVGSLEGEIVQAPEEAPVVYPPCPWRIIFYPDQETAEVVEVLL